MTQLDQEIGRQILHELLRAVQRSAITCPRGGVHLSEDITEGLSGTIHLHGRPVNLLVRVSLGMLRRTQWLMFPQEPDGTQTCLITGSGMAILREWESDHPESYDSQLLGRHVVPARHACLDLDCLNDCFHDGTDTT